MLLELHIRNFAIISRLDIGFSSGFTVLSGETGAGKSIIVDALNLVLGSRASADLIRTGAEEAEVEAVFRAPGALPEDALEWGGLGMEPGAEFALRRIVYRGGRSRATVNGHVVNLGLLSQIGERVVNIFGQHEHHSLVRPERHLDILDEFGGLEAERAAYEALYGEVVSVKQALSQADDQAEARRERLDLHEFQIREIDQAALTPNEETELERERGVLQNAERLMGLAREGEELLYASDGALCGALSELARRIGEFGGVEERFGRFASSLEEAQYQIEDVALRLREYADAAHFDPGRLAEVEERLEEIGGLKRKYRRDVAGILALRVDLAAEVAKLRGVSVSREELEARYEDGLKDLLRRAEALSQKRRRAASLLEERTQAILERLALEGARFAATWNDTGEEGEGPAGLSCGEAMLDARGMDRVEFYISANVGEELKPLARIASGGELSRVMLALRHALAQVDFVPTLIFDEVDAGIGGRVAELVGRTLRDMTTRHQILCITHLPQIACLAANHFRVSKQAVGERAESRVELLEEQSTVAEIARMLGGLRITEKTLAQAKEMLHDARH